MALKLSTAFGLTGVSPTENAKAQLTARMFEGPMLLLAGWIIIDWYLQASEQVNIYAISDWVIWVFFISETLVLSFLVDKPLDYLKGNWINLVIIFFSFPLLWYLFPYAAGFRTLRLVVLFTLLAHVSKSMREILGRNHLGSTLVASFFIIVAAGTLMSLIDPNVHTPFDGIWWAWVTVTTVGYGDIVPGSDAGRIFGAFLILLGIGLFSMLTANFAAFFVAIEEKDLIKEEDENIHRLGDIENRLLLLEHKLDMLLTDEQKNHAHTKHSNEQKSIE